MKKNLPTISVILYTSKKLANNSHLRMLINVGVGADYSLTDKISVGAEIKFQYIKDFNRMPFKVGVIYKL